MSHEVYSMKDLETALDVTRQTLNNWRKSGAPIPKVPPFDVDAIVAWREKQPPHGRTTVEKSNLSEQEKKAKTRLATLRADWQELQNAIKSGRLVHVEDTESVLLEQSNSFRRELSNMENVFAERFVGLENVQQAKAKLHEIGRDILGRLYKGEKG